MYFSPVKCVTPAAGKDTDFFSKDSELTIDSTSNIHPLVDWPLNCLGPGHGNFSEKLCTGRWLRVLNLVQGGPMMAIFRLLLTYDTQNFTMPRP